MKKLDKLILKSFLGPFIVTFFVAVFVLMMQILWKYVDDLVGKGLDFLTIGKFLWYAGASLLTLAMPIAILISSIMTFGNLGESFELVAIKSAGISLLRFMQPLMWVAVLLCGVTFIFANYVIPYSQLKFVTLYNDIYYKKPAFDLKEGVFFNQIPGYSIRAGEKDKDGKTIRNVLIYEHSNPIQDNAITAETGVMKTSQTDDFLEFNLENGYRYQENGNSGDSSTEYIRLQFREFKKLFDLSILKMSSTSDSVFRNNAKMLSARQLTRSTDSVGRVLDTLKSESAKTSRRYFHYFGLNENKYPDSLKKKMNIPDSLVGANKDRAIGVLTDLKGALQFSVADLDNKSKEIRFLDIEWHRKYALSMACLVLFFIGAPLGSIIRKGGLGMPLLVSIIFFLIFHLLNMFGEKFVKEGIMSPAAGMWLAVYALAPVGIFFTYKAMNDSQLFNKEYYLRTAKKLRKMWYTLIAKNK